MKSIHLVAALISLCIVMAGVAIGVNDADGLEQEYVHAVAPLHPDINITGIALQKAAFNQPDLLPVYGASEVLRQASKFQASQFFMNYPTGFETFEVAHSASASLIYVETAAALGSELQGKKIVISFTPSQFFQSEIHLTQYAANFSRLHANELAFSGQLSYLTKQLAARRMLQYPNTLASDPVLKFALVQLAANTPLSQVLYYLSYPLGKLQTWILELQDHFETVIYIRSVTNKVSPNVTHRPESINWDAEVAEALKKQMPQSNNNPYGIANTTWKSLSKKFKSVAPGTDDSRFINNMDKSREWYDLSLLLLTLHELGAQPILIGRPTKDAYYNSQGISDNALQDYYTEIDQLAQAYSVPIVDFKDFQNDLYFGVDPAPHTSQEGWVYVDQALNAFYHETTP